MEDREIKGFQCNDCGYSTKTKNDLYRHIRTHTGERPYGCALCEKSFTSPGNRNRHQLTHTGEKRFQCEICLVRFTEKGSLTKHSRIHTGENLFECDRCSRKFSQSGHLRAHILTHTGEKLFKCPICEKSFTSGGYLKEHQYVHEKREYPCERCGVVLTNYSAFRKHRRRHDLKNGVKKKVSCSVCSKEFADTYGCKRHLQEIHLGEKAFNCETCGKGFRTKYHLRQHSSAHAVPRSSKSFKCSRCEKQFISKSSFRHHMQQYEGEFYYCPHCSLGFVSRSDLDEHWEVHPGQPIVCVECKEVFSSLTGLKLHNHNRILEKNLRCPFCDKLFVWKKSLIRHMKLHHADDAEVSCSDVIRPFPCSKCSDEFSSEKSFIWHEVCIHNNVKLLEQVADNDAYENDGGDSDNVDEIIIPLVQIEEQEDNDGILSCIPNETIFIKQEIVDGDSVDTLDMISPSDDEIHTKENTTIVKEENISIIDIKQEGVEDYL